MNISDVAAEWNDWREQSGDFELFDEIEKEAAQELVEAKPHIPVKYLEKCGLDKVESVDELLNDRERLLHMAAYFSGLSICGGAEIKDEEINYDIHLDNVHLFCAVLIIELAATLWHLNGILPIKVSIGLANEETKRALEEVLCETAGWFDSVKSCECYVEKNADEKEEEENIFDSEWIKELNCAAAPYGSGEEAHNYSLILDMFRLGMETNSYAAFPAKLSFDENGDPQIRPEIFRNRDGKKFLVIQTRPCGKFSCLARGRLLGLAAEMSDKSITGFVINPYDEAIIVSRYFVAHVMQAIFSKAKHFELTVNRPMRGYEFEQVEYAIRSLVHEDADSYLALSFNNPVDDDEILFMQTKKWGDGYRVELAYDMSAFEWEHPLILAADNVSEKMTLELFRRIGLDAEKSADIGYVAKNFRDIGFGR